MQQQAFPFDMPQNLDKILARLENSIDSDDVIKLVEEIECDLAPSDIIELKKMLKDIIQRKVKINHEPLHIKYLMSYLLDSDNLY